jgi:hypothetical protein
MIVAVQEARANVVRAKFGVSDWLHTVLLECDDFPELPWLRNSEWKKCFWSRAARGQKQPGSGKKEQKEQGERTNFRNQMSRTSRVPVRGTTVHSRSTSTLGCSHVPSAL